MIKKVIVIGGGAAGYFTAINIAEKSTGLQVMILEKTNKTLSKVKVSGGGRCNVTHACFDNKELVEFYPRGKRELLGPLSRFSVSDLIAWFSDRGVELKMEEDGRMFPTSDSSQTIIDCFEKSAANAGVKVKLKAEVVEIDANNTKTFNVQLKSGESLSADAIVVATGGSPKASHYNSLSKLGHNIHDPIPSLFTFNLPKHDSNQLMGLALNATVKLKDTKFEEYGPLLFTHWGMSGPAILKLSSKAAHYLHKKNYQFQYEVCWLDHAIDFIEEQRKTNASKKVGVAKPVEFPVRFWSYLLAKLKIKPDKNWADLDKQEIERLTLGLEADLYHAQGKTTFKEEFVTCGGVELSEINMPRMESKIHPNLFFCGEVINVDALTGGFNFQSAWTTAWLVSEAIGKGL